MRDHAMELRKQAVAAGLIPDDELHASSAHRPWPVLLLIGIGAWLSGTLLIVGIAALLHRWLIEGAATYAIGGLCLFMAAMILRQKERSSFVEQLAIPMLALGIGLFAYASIRDLDPASGLALTGCLLSGLALALPHAWIRALLGAAAAGVFAGAWAEINRAGQNATASMWHGWLILLALWAIALRAQARLIRSPRSPEIAAVLEAFAGGWLLTIVAGLCMWSGQTFLLGGGLGLEGTHQGLSGWSAARSLPPYGSILLALAATIVLIRAWPSLRKLPFYACAAVALWLAWAAPAGGPVLLALTVCLTTRRPLLATACAVALVWIIGSFYYQLSWSLQQKAAVLLVAGIVLGATAWLARGAMNTQAPSVDSRRGWLIGLSLLGTLLLINHSIYEKEQLIAHGRPIYIELRPVDPRSLIQGDYMRLNFMPLDAVDLPGKGRHATIALEIDARGVATRVRPERDGQKSRNVIRLPIKREGGRWILVTNAWSFREGEAARWAAARYGEIRVDRNGKAVLVGLVGERFQPL